LLLDKYGIILIKMKKNGEKGIGIWKILLDLKNMK